MCRWEHGWRLRHRDLVREKAVQGGTTHTKAEMSGEGGRGCTKGSRERKVATVDSGSNTVALPPEVRSPVSVMGHLKSR